MNIDPRSWRERVAGLLEELRPIVQAAGTELRPNGLAARERVEIGHDEPIGTVVGQALILCESTSEHVAATLAALQEPALVLASFTCLRTAAETAALAWWLLEPAIDARERVARSLAFRRKGVDEQRKWATESSDIDLAHVKSRLACIDEDRKRLGVPTLSVPAATKLVADTFGDSGDYRLTSAVVHGHFWAIHQVGFITMPREEGAEIVSLSKAAKPEVLLYTLLIAVEALSRTTWVTTRYVGGDLEAIEQSLTRAYRDLRIARDRWFWSLTTG